MTRPQGALPCSLQAVEINVTLHGIKGVITFTQETTLLDLTGFHHGLPGRQLKQPGQGPAHYQGLSAHRMNLPIKCSRCYVSVYMNSKLYQICFVQIS